MHFRGRRVGRDGIIRELHAHPILRRLIYSCEHTLRALYTRPYDSVHELKLRIVAAIETIKARMLENSI